MKKTCSIQFCFAVFFLAGFVCWNNASAQTETAAPAPAETKIAEPEVEKTLLQKLHVLVRSTLVKTYAITLQ